MVDGATLEIVINKKCRYCDIQLTILNAVKRGKTQFRNFCKKCRSAGYKGEENSNAKLTEKNVLEIRELFKNKHKVKEIAHNYDITTNYCRAICMRTTWKHI